MFDNLSVREDMKELSKVIVWDFSSLAICYIYLNYENFCIFQFSCAHTRANLNSVYTALGLLLKRFTGTRHQSALQINPPSWLHCSYSHIKEYCYNRRAAAYVAKIKAIIIGDIMYKKSIHFLLFYSLKFFSLKFLWCVYRNEPHSRVYLYSAAIMYWSKNR